MPIADSAVGKKWWRAKPKLSEAQLHRAVARYLTAVLRPPVTWTTFPAGGGGLRRGVQLKAMGLRAGMPDLLVLAPAGEYTMVLGLELKAAKGRLSPEQVEASHAFAAAGAEYRVCRSIDDVESALAMAGIPLHATVSGIRRAAA